MRPALRHVLVDESGISLIMVMGILGVFSITAASLMAYSSSNARSAHYQKNSEMETRRV